MRSHDQIIAGRIRQIKEGKEVLGPVIYWMSRDQRVNDNWALLYSQELAQKNNVALVVAFCLVPDFLNATIRHYDFMLEGLKEVEASLKKKNIPFVLLEGDPVEQLTAFLSKHKAGKLVTDFDPLRPKRQWKEKLIECIDISVYEVDAHNIIPCWQASPKQEYGAYTIRPKIKKQILNYLDDFPLLEENKVSLNSEIAEIKWDQLKGKLKVNRDVKEINWLKPGEQAAQKTLELFLSEKFCRYAQEKNDPSKDALSNLSPYLHFGQISAQRVAMKASQAGVHNESKDSFLEELIVRRELSDNYCFYNPAYDDLKTLPNWAYTTLDKHRKDVRKTVYTLDKFETARTHDELWNAAQSEMLKTGKMHGYMRMYWAKKILEWSESPEQALEYAIYLNDKYELDGRDPNGYTGIMWSIGGLHDRAWKEREIFGKIRFMSYNGCKTKFDIKIYIEKTHKL